ncbi:ATP-NAD kinase [Haloferax mediterranei ATCC 33500]|uniref:ATP-NAD kinase n=1 Tax=Haloferax mediterranei (strain ATCC 33500 / DSM 1411 / JCM 8866 / NBRC 14739 / NCIMB 2177 / R-4) TaxID=523841 RepID=I3R2R9_HALMT|nr:NAD(+)/NADH kinase [Haloferax mediterranei]AFK18529.1 ATP-NAD kinase [Haloferax mediterranei ATCC 33500]AHZ22091.1 ATP-NAD kinase [Haloferax mediterranei ATCC 33500]EMA02197.1 ATP-NAD kinase [Haloferax mediterranei ATCC 33500]MDX5988619.1 NAD(+)/NADH kinase [Haloferax mediterranei ATCC 33500]QCQ75034.1 ATP-NAD kinase [Haloferax mediterranei ATCC 33500]
MKFAVVGDESVGTAVRDAGATVVPPNDAEDADAVVAVGEASVSAIALDSTWDCPVLPVDCGMPWSVPHRRLEAHLAPILAGEGRVVDYPTLSVRVEGDHAGRALFDAMLVTSEPAHISEYGVAHASTAVPFSAGVDDDSVDDSTVVSDDDDTDDVWTPVDEFRADGVVVATPLGSSGYARATGGAVVGPDAGVAVVPVSPYATQNDSWVFQPPLRLTVERDDAPVSLVVDTEVAREVAPFESVVVERDDTVPLLLG